MSPSSRGRGLKYKITGIKQCTYLSPSSRGRGLKSAKSTSTFRVNMSPSSRGRGLKFANQGVGVGVGGRPHHEGVA